MVIKWKPLNKHGKHLELYNEVGEAIGEIFLWNDYGNGKKIRINWIMVKKNEQGKGLGTMMLEEVKRNIKTYFPEAQVLIFDKVTSMGMLNLIKKVFQEVELYINEHLPEDWKLEKLNRGVQLPEKSPAKYNKDGSCRIPKSARSENFIVHLK